MAQPTLRIVKNEPPAWKKAADIALKILLGFFALFLYTYGCVHMVLRK